MKVWIVTDEYEYGWVGVYATKELADAAAEEYTSYSVEEEEVTMPTDH